MYIKPQRAELRNVADDPNESKCVVIISGHGSYHPKVLPKPSSINYRIFFPVALDTPISDSHHNLLLSLLALDFEEGLNLFRSLPSTYLAHQNIPETSPITLDAKETSYVHEQFLGNADDVCDQVSLISLNAEKWIGLFIQSKAFSPRCIRLTVDIERIHEEIEKVRKADNYKFDADNKGNNMISLRRSCVQIELERDFFGNQVFFKLSQFLSLIPMIRVPLLYNSKTNTVEILGHIYEHSANGYTADEVFQKFAAKFNDEEKYYYEAVIPNDAFIVWDASRMRSA